MSPTSIVDNPWDSLEVAKLLVGILTPISVAAIGWFISRRLRQLDQHMWASQKVIEKRIEVYDQIAPKLNSLFCFLTWVGNWKDVSPEDVIVYKRDLDKTMNIYRHLFEDEVFGCYQSYIHCAFRTFYGPGEDAKIRSAINSSNGDRTKHCSYEWDENWNSRFAEGHETELSEVREKYYKLMNTLSRSIGIEEKAS